MIIPIHFGDVFAFRRRCRTDLAQYPVRPWIATGSAGKLRQKNDGNPRPNRVGI